LHTNQGLSPGAAWEPWFKIAGHGHQIPSWEGQKPKASGWVFMTENPPRRCGEGFSSLHPLQGGDFQTPCHSGAKFRYQAARMWEARPTVRLTPYSRRWRRPGTFYRCGGRIIPPRNASVTRGLECGSLLSLLPHCKGVPNNEHITPPQGFVLRGKREELI